MNKVFLAGRLASDPQQFVSRNGIIQSRLTIACNDVWNKNNEAHFFPCVAWQSTANFINTYLKKGDPVVVDGKLIRRSYVSKEGKNVYIIEVVVENIRPFGSSKSSKETNTFNSRNTASYEEFDKPKLDDNEIQNQLNNDNEFLLNDTNGESNSTMNNESDEVVDLDWMNEL